MASAFNAVLYALYHSGSCKSIFGQPGTRPQSLDLPLHLNLCQVGSGVVECFLDAKYGKLLPYNSLQSSNVKMG